MKRGFRAVRFQGQTYKRDLRNRNDIKIVQLVNRIDVKLMMSK